MFMILLSDNSPLQSDISANLVLDEAAELLIPIDFNLGRGCLVVPIEILLGLERKFVLLIPRISKFESEEEMFSDGSNGEEDREIVERFSGDWYTASDSVSESKPGC